MKNCFLKCTFAIVVMWCFTFGTQSCRKNKADQNSADTTYIDSITYSACDYAGELISFSFIIVGPGNVGIKSLLWDFGDGTTSNVPIGTTHVYSSAGTYVVSLAVNGREISKSISIVPYFSGSFYTYQMKGLRHWVGTEAVEVNEFGVFTADSTKNVDTELTIQIVNSGIIRLPFFGNGLTLNLANIDNVGKVLTFSSCSSWPSAVLSYYYGADSIVYTDNWSPPPGGGHEFEEFMIHSP